MAQAFLEPADKAILDAASEDGVVAAAIRLRSDQFSRNRWLDPKSRYYDSVVSKIQKDTGSASKNLSENDIGEYVAASAPLHGRSALQLAPSAGSASHVLEEPHVRLP